MGQWIKRVTDTSPLDNAIKLLLSEGYPAKWIALKIKVSYHRVLRADPQRFASAVRKK